MRNLRSGHLSASLRHAEACEKIRSAQQGLLVLRANFYLAEKVGQGLG